MTMMEKPAISIFHQLPGRVRFRLSHGLRFPGQAISRVTNHPGIMSAEYTQISRSFLVRFDPMLVSREKITIRVALCLSLDYAEVPVRILAQPHIRGWSNAPFFSGFALAVAQAARIAKLDGNTTLMLDWIAGLSTAGAVLHHGWLELRHRGFFDPEVLSVVYLGTAFLRRQFFTASLVTWFATFGRHLLRPPPRALKCRVTHTRGDSQGGSRYQIVISEDRDENIATKISRFIPAVIQYAGVAGITSGEGLLVSNIRDMVSVHDEILGDLKETKTDCQLELNSNSVSSMDKEDGQCLQETISSVFSRD